MRILVRKGVDLEAKVYAEYTPLEIAAKNGRLEAALLLLHSGADVECTMSNSFTPLSTAISSGSVRNPPWFRDSMVRLLLEHGAMPICISE